VLLCLIATNPRVEMGVDDDWSYIFSAKALAATGHIAYNGWAAAILVPQLYLGALFIRIFGFSFTAVRASGMLLTLLTVPLFYALLRRVRIRAWNATIGTLTLFVSPVYIPLAVKFMSDSFAMFFLAAFLYACIRFVQARTDRRAMLWLASAAALSLVGGAERQTVWLCVLVSLPCLVWRHRTRPAILRAGVVLWGASSGFAVWMNHWFHAQQFVAVESLIGLPYTTSYLRLFGVRLAQSAFVCLLLFLPLGLGVALTLRVKHARQAWITAGTLAVALAGFATVTVRGGGRWWDMWLPGNTVTAQGISWHPEVLGFTPLVVPPWVQAVTALITAAAAVVCMFALWWRSGADAKAPLQETDRSVAWITAAFLVCYLPLVFTRLFSFDRYFLPVLLIAVIWALRWYELRVGERISLLTLVPLVALGFYGVAGTHDLFAMSRARLDAAKELQAAGVPRSAFHAGVEFDQWTQVELTGHVNEPRIRPASAYAPVALPLGLEQLHPSGVYTAHRTLDPSEQQCYLWFVSYTPSIHGQYILQNAPGYCFSDAAFAPARYRTWLPPHDHALYIAEVPQKFR
jgi:hypothetical protein